MLVNGKWVFNATCRKCRHRHPPEMTCEESAAVANAAKKAGERLPCELCGILTPLPGYPECDGCWELRTRIEAQPELAKRILEDMES